MATPYIRVRLLGVISTDDTWSVNPCFATGATGVPTQAAMDTWASNIAALNLGSILPTTIKGWMSSAVGVSGVRLEWVNAAGAVEVVSEHLLDAPQFGGAAVNMPSECAVVTSLQTSLIGRRYRGRLYWPLLAVRLDDTTTRIHTPTTSAIATAVASWLQDVADALGTGTDYDPVVVSKAAGTNAVVTGIKVGDVMDSQRRRRNGMKETYATVVIPAD